MSKRDEARRNYIVAALVEAGSMFERDARSYLAEHDAVRRDEVLNEAIQSLHEVWRLAPESSRADGINFAIGALMSVRDHPRAMASPAAAPVPAETAEATVEFGVRVPYCAVLTPTPDRAEAEARLARLRDMHPTAVLVRRTVRYGAWTEATS